MVHGLSGGAEGAAQYAVGATVTKVAGEASTWKALLKPAATGGSYAITASVQFNNRCPHSEHHQRYFRRRLVRGVPCPPSLNCERMSSFPRPVDNLPPFPSGNTRRSAAAHPPPFRPFPG